MAIISLLVDAGVNEVFINFAYKELVFRVIFGIQFNLKCSVGLTLSSSFHRKSANNDA